MRIACLLVPNLPLAAELRAHPELAGEPFAVTTGSDPRAEILSVSPRYRVVKALYEIDAPRGGWTHEHNGFYPVVLWEDAVSDRLGNSTERQRLGGFEVAIDNSQPPVPAEAELRVDASNPDRVRTRPSSLITAEGLRGSPVWVSRLT